VGDQGDIFNTHDTEVVLGANAARDLGYELGTSLHLSHGLGEVSFHHHDEFDFHVVGILNRTGTPIDNAIYTSLESIERIHSTDAHDHSGSEKNIIDEKDHDHTSKHGHEHNNHSDHDAHHDHDHSKHDHTPDEHMSDLGDEHHHLTPSSITAVFVGLRSPSLAPRFNRSINTYEDEALLAIMPGFTLVSLWSIVGSVDLVLKGIAIFVVGVGIITVLIAILTNMQSRRREMAILRTLGASRTNIFSLIISEAALLAGIGAVLGALSLQALFVFLGPWVQSQFGLSLRGLGLGPLDIAVIVGVTLLSALFACFPALKTLNTALKDGLTLRV
jgi:putative ABC transport system permease protein